MFRIFLSGRQERIPVELGDLLEGVRLALLAVLARVVLDGAILC